MFFEQEQARERRKRRFLIGDTNAAYAGGETANELLRNLEDDSP